MSLVSTVLAIAAGYGIATAMGKGKTKELEALLTQKKETTKQATEPVNEKPEHEKDVIDVLADIAYREELSHFNLIERRNGKARYEFEKEEQDLLFTVVVEEEYVECKVTCKGSVVIAYIYDRSWDEFQDDKKTIVRSIIEGHDYEEAMEVIEEFIYKVNNYDWHEPEGDFEIIDDLKGVKPASKKSASKPVPTLDGFAEMEKMKVAIEAQEIKDEIGETVLTIIEKIKKATAEIEHLEKELDVEAKHVYDDLIKKDLSKLFHAYLKLEEENRVVYKEKILDGLARIESKTSEILEQIEHKNLHEIDTILHVIKQRYEE